MSGPSEGLYPNAMILNYPLASRRNFARKAPELLVKPKRVEAAGDHPRHNCLREKECAANNHVDAFKPDCWINFPIETCWARCTGVIYHQGHPTEFALRF